jgi:hypothetical protein
MYINKIKNIKKTVFSLKMNDDGACRSWRRREIIAWKASHRP